MKLRKFREQLEQIPEKFWDLLDVVVGDTSPNAKHEYGGAFEFGEIIGVEVPIPTDLSQPKCVIRFRQGVENVDERVRRSPRRRNRL